MNIPEIKNIIDQAFSKTGYSQSGFTVFLPKKLSLEIESNEDGTKVLFKDNLPKVKTRKLFISITTELENIFFGKNEGHFKLKNFPNFKFQYEEKEQIFGSTTASDEIDIDKLKEEIRGKYPDTKRQKIAKLALEYANEWATVSSNNGIRFAHCGEENRRKLHDDCYNFVIANIISSKQLSTSATLSFVLLYFILPAIVNWVVKKFLNNLINKPSMYLV